MSESTGATGRPGLFAALKGLLANVLAIGRTRAELLVNEIEEEKFRLISLWSKAIGAAFMLALALIMVVFCLALAFWEQRVFVFGGFAALFAIVGFVLVSALRRQMQEPSSLFRSSLGELETDLAALRREPPKA